MPGFGDTMADDYEVVAADFGETVTYTQGGVSAPVNAVVALEISRAEVQASNGFFGSQDLVFLLPVAELTVTPREGDTIARSDSTEWSVFPQRLEAAGNQWRVIGKKQR